MTALILANELQEDHASTEMLDIATNSIVDMNARIDQVLGKKKVSSIV